MLSLATVILANALMNGAIPLNYEHRDYKLKQAEIFLRDSKIYDLSNLQGGIPLCLYLNQITTLSEM